MCVQKDDITELLPAIEECDAILVATPIYNHQITSQAKLFIERLYPFFHGEKNMSNTSKFGKKAALVCSCWGGPKDIYEKYAAWTVKGFSQIGAEETKSLVFDQIPAPGAIKEREDYMEKVHELAKWLVE
jgi:multimeric flavodoxin WrbA